MHGLQPTISTTPDVCGSCAPEAFPTIRRHPSSVIATPIDVIWSCKEAGDGVKMLHHSRDKLLSWCLIKQNNLQTGIIYSLEFPAWNFQSRIQSAITYIGLYSVHSLSLLFALICFLKSEKKDLIGMEDECFLAPLASEFICNFS